MSLLSSLSSVSRPIGTIFGSIVLCTPLVAGPSNPDTSRATSPTNAARQTYRKACADCHGEDGSGNPLRKAAPAIPDFTDPRWHADRSDGQLKRAVLEGKGDSMPSMKQQLGDIEVESLIVLVRSFARRDQAVSPKRSDPITLAERPAAGAADPGDARRDLPPPPAKTGSQMPKAGALYRRYCVTCHGADGKGSSARAGMPALPDFTNRAWQDSRGDPQFQASILNGKGTLMPPFAGRLAAADTRDLIAYLRTFGPPRPATSVNPTSDFARRFEELQRQWDALERELDQLSPENDEKLSPKIWR